MSIYIYTHTHSASECTFNYKKKRVEPLNVHDSQPRALLCWVLESKSIHLPSAAYQVSSSLSHTGDWCVPTPQPQMGLC